MHCIRFAFIWAALGVLLAGCALSNVNPDYALKAEGPRGLVAVAFTYSGAPMGTLQWRLRQLNTRPQPGASQADQFVQVFGGKGPADWPPPIGMSVPDSRLAGRLAVFELPAGKYEFWRWEGTNAGYLLNSGKPLSIRFAVEPGKANYVGNLHLFWENPRYGVRVFDRSQRDLELLRKKVPSVTDGQIVTQLAEVPEKSEK